MSGNRSGQVSMLGMFPEDNAGDLRIVPWRRKDEPAVVPQVSLGLPRGFASTPAR